MDGTAKPQSAEHVHARLEDNTATAEGLQSATDGGVLLKHRHTVTFLRKQGSCKESPQTASNNQTVFPCLGLLFYYLPEDVL